MGRSGLQRAMNSRMRGCILLLGSEDLWGAKRNRGRIGRCEQSSFRKRSWARHLIPHCSPQSSDVGSSLFSSCLSTSNTHQTSSSIVYLLNNCFYVNRTQPAPPRLCLAVFPFWGELVALRLLSWGTHFWSYFPMVEVPRVCLGECLSLMGGQAESARGQRVARSGSVSGDQKLGGGVWARAAHETRSFCLLQQILFVDI